LETIILPRSNEKDLYLVPEHIKKTLKFIYVDEIDQVIKLALEDGQKNSRKKS
jgi:ATP-dependent Lon protease